MNPGAAGSIPVDHPRRQYARDGQEGAMPKEYIESAEFFPESDNSPRKPIKTKITWSREDAGGHVQMTVFRDEGTYQSEHELPMYMTLERSQINRMIRVLRRARDQAFGRDE